MIVFPNAKINIGLNVIERRSDGFHNIQTVFYPIPLFDILEFIPNGKSETIFTNSGLIVDSIMEENLCIKAFRLLQKDFNLPEVQIHLHKIIPFGAGLGGGSSDAAFMLKSLNEYFRLQISQKKLKQYALNLGSDCAFFVSNIPAFAEGRGEILSYIELTLENKYLVLIKPDIHISTKLAYSGVIPTLPEISLRKAILQPINHWRNTIKNDFELSVFKTCPILDKIKHQLYDAGADYAAMSGSGSTIYGIFDNVVNLNQFKNAGFVWGQVL
jgi:4-diphosphocytidyl-2-C-methyl-D-erythritol kinase